MSWPAKPLSLLASALLAVGSLAGCKKGDATNVDLPNVAAIGTTYADLPVAVSTVRLDTIYTLKSQHYLAGRLTDALTGTTEARAVLNLRVGVDDSLPGRFTNAAEPDSVVVYTGFDNVYGSTAQPARLDVLALDSMLDERTVYNSNSVPKIGATIGTNYAVPLTNTTSVKQVVSGTTDSTTTQVLNRVVRIVVQRQQALANPAYPAVASSYATNLFQQLQTYSLTQDQLNTFLPGIVLAPSAGYNGAVLSFSRVVSGAVLVYFHPSSSNKKRTYALRFGPSVTGVGPASANDPRYYTQLTTDFSSNALMPLQGNSATRLSIAATGGTSYVQEGTGLGMALDFKSPQFDSLLTKRGIAINRAELLMPVQPYSNAVLGNPISLYALEVNNNNVPLQRVTGLLSLDRMVQADGFTQAARGNEAVGTEVNTNSTKLYYDMLITSYLQAYLSDPVAGTLGGVPDALVITPSLSTNSNLTLNRAAIDGNNVRLRVYYSQLRQ